MEWTSVIGPLVAVAVVVIMRKILGKKKKEGGVEAGIASKEEFYEHLRAERIEASLAEDGDSRGGVGLGRASGQKSEGIIKLEDRHIDSINIVNMTGQFGTSHFVDYLVKSPNMSIGRAPQKTRLTVKKSPPVLGKVVGIRWSGDKSLAQTLNLDYSLEDKLLSAIQSNFKGDVWIFPEPKQGYTRIRTDYFPPSVELFGAISIIARYIRSW